MMNNLDLSQAPKDIRDTLVQQMDSAWKKHYPARRAVTEEAAFDSILEQTGYLLQMHWQGRTDKYSRELRVAFDWIGENGIVRHDEVDQKDAVKQAITQIFEAYKRLPGADLPTPAIVAKPGFFSRIFGR
jgi:hypothetical protein